MRAVNLSTGPFCTEFWCEQLCDDEVFGIGVERLPQDINTEMVMKMVAVRAVNSPIGAFCTEFWCEQLCDDDVFLALGSGNRVWNPFRSGRSVPFQTVSLWIEIRSVPNRSVPDRNSFRSEPFRSVPDRNPFRSEPFRAAISIEKPFRSVPGTSLLGIKTPWQTR